MNGTQFHSTATGSDVYLISGRRLICGSRKRRRGYSLVEVLLAVAILSMVMSAMAVAMQAMFRVDRQLRNEAVYGQVVPRLSLQLRTDVHAASGVSLLDAADRAAGVLLTTARTGEVIEYQSEAGRVIRTRRRDGLELGREVYSLGKTTWLDWHFTASPPMMVELEIVRALGKIDSADSRQVDRVVAAVGIRVPREKEGAVDASAE